MTTYLSDLVSTQAFVQAIRGGFISERTHHVDNSLRVYSYTPKTQFSGRWTPETRLARGLMLRVVGDDLTTAQVVGRGLPKFFTIQQSQDSWGRPKLVDDDEGVTVEEAAELPWDAPAVVAEKLNGALGLAYNGPEGLAVSTKGSFGSREAEIATGWLRSHLTPEEQARFTELLPGETALFEIITPERPHPVDYGTKEALFLLGTVEHASGLWKPAESRHPLVTELRFELAPQLPQATLREAVELPYRENTEGLVVTVEAAGVQHLYKVKPPEYLALRKAFYAAEAVDLSAHLLSLSSGELESLTADQLPIPPQLRGAEEKRASVEAELLKPLAEKLTEVRAEYRALRGNKLPERGTFAQAVKSSSVSMALLFKAYDEELTGEKRLAAPVLVELIKASKKRG